MEEIIKSIIGSFDLVYIGVVVFAIWFVLYTLLPNPKKITKILVSIGIGIAVGILWFQLYGGVTILSSLLLSFFAAQVL